MNKHLGHLTKKHDSLWDMTILFQKNDAKISSFFQKCKTNV